MNVAALSTPHKLVAGAIAVVAVSAFLPWISVLGITKLGISGDGIITLLLAVAGGAVLAWSTGLVGAGEIGTKPGPVAGWGLVALGALTALIGLVDLNSFAAFGLYLTLLGGLAWAGGAVWAMTAGSPATDQPETTAP